MSFYVDSTGGIHNTSPGPAYIAHQSFTATGGSAGQAVAGVLDTVGVATTGLPVGHLLLAAGDAANANASAYPPAVAPGHSPQAAAGSFPQVAGSYAGAGYTSYGVAVQPGATTGPDYTLWLIVLGVATLAVMILKKG